MIYVYYVHVKCVAQVEILKWQHYLTPLLSSTASTGAASSCHVRLILIHVFSDAASNTNKI